MKSKDGIVRVGGVGTGRIFHYAHLHPYPRLWEKARLVGFYDLNRDRAEWVLGEYRAILEKYAEQHPPAAQAVQANIAELKVHDSLESLLEQVDIVDVCTHSRGRMAAALAALDAGVHSMVEKPMARTWIEADRAVKAFEAKPDVFLQLNDDNVFDAKYATLRDLVAKGTVGRVQSLWAIRGSELKSTSVLKSQADALANGGGCLMDYGSHGLAGVWYALGTHLKVKKVEAASIDVRFRHRVLEGDPVVVEVEDNAQVKVLLEDPETGSWITVFLEASWCGGHIGLPHPDKNGSQSGGWLRIEGDAGEIFTTSNDLIKITRWDGGETVLPLHVPDGMRVSYGHEIETFIDCVRASAPPAIDVNFGAEIIAIVEAAYLSAIRRRAVTLEEFKDYARGYVDKHGDNEQAEEALLADLLAPYKAEG